MLPIDNTVAEVSGLPSNVLPDEYQAATEPFVIRGLVSTWPLVEAARAGSRQAVEYLLSYYDGATVGAFFGPPSIDGRVFYNDDMSGFNYRPLMVKLDQLLHQLMKDQESDESPMYYVGSTTVDTCLPGFRSVNDVDFGEKSPLASIWLGNQSRIAAHFDVPDNLACVAAGRRRFILFPPDELHNLYIGPLDFNPAGQAISLVDFANPDYQEFPRFRDALKKAQLAELGPGDALFIPSMWWHHVEACDHFNVLINYWWRQSPAYMGMPMNVLNLALLAIRDLPEEQKKAWKSILDHYVFDASAETAKHIPPEHRGSLSPMDDTNARRLRADLLNKLNK